MTDRRTGLWLIAGASAIELVLQLGLFAAFQLLRAYGWWDFGHAKRVIELVGWATIGLTAVVTCGAVLCARASTGTQRRAFVSLAAFAVIGTVFQMLPAVVDTHSLALAQWCDRVNVVAWLAAVVSFVRAVRGDVSPRLVRAMWIVLAAQTVAYVIGQVWLGGLLGVLPRPLELTLEVARWLRASLWLVLALDALGAFAGASGAPVATTSTRARSAAGACAIVLCVLGSALAATALWVTELSDSALTGRDPLIVGVLLFVVGASVLAALRGRPISSAVVIASTIGVTLVGQRVLRQKTRPVEEVSLVELRVPGAVLALPDGRIDRDVDFRERGRLSILTHHADLGLVSLMWTAATMDPLDRDHLGTSGEPLGFEGAVPIRGYIWTGEHLAQLRVSWQCPRGRWYLLEVSRYDRDPAPLRVIGKRVLATVRCTEDEAGAPPLAIEVPAGYAARWSLDDSFVDALAHDPQALLGVAGAVTPLDPVVPAPAAEGVIESNERAAVEVRDGETRTLAVAWRCFDLDADVLATHTGPASEPREGVLRVLGAIACPR